MSLKAWRRWAARWDSQGSSVPKAATMPTVLMGRVGANCFWTSLLHGQSSLSICSSHHSVTLHNAFELNPAFIVFKHKRSLPCLCDDMSQQGHCEILIAALIAVSPSPTGLDSSTRRECPLPRFWGSTEISPCRSGTGGVPRVKSWVLLQAGEKKPACFNWVSFHSNVLLIQYF